MKIILGLTGSVATSIAPKIAKAIQEINNVEVVCVMTEKAKVFCNESTLIANGFKVFSDKDEWTNTWHKDDPIMHINLRKDASALVIAPASMNTIAKMAHGLNDNLLTSLYAAWDINLPVIIAPAMNTKMYLSQTNQNNLNILEKSGVNIVDPITKKLACGEIGRGALADVYDIAKFIKKTLTWAFPLDKCAGIPVNHHLGAFGAFRKYNKRHCGVDLYCNNGDNVYAVETGEIVSINGFTGASVGSPWWNETQAIKVQGASGVVTYGEVKVNEWLKVGKIVKQSEFLGKVSQVLKDGEIREDIPGHSLSMLHLQLYTHGTYHKDESWIQNNPIPNGVLDPTPFLINADPNIKKLYPNGVLDPAPN